MDLTCQDCGITSPDVYETTDPYSDEILCETVDIVVCPDCYDLRGDEI